MDICNKIKKIINGYVSDLVLVFGFLILIGLIEFEIINYNGLIILDGLLVIFTNYLCIKRPSEKSHEVTKKYFLFFTVGEFIMILTTLQ